MSTAAGVVSSKRGRDPTAGSLAADQASTPAARSVIMKKVPDIRLQKPEITVAIITNSKRRRSMRAPRSVLRMMMKGAAKTRNGTAAKVFGAHAPAAGRSPAGRCRHCLVAAGQRAREREADAKSENREFRASGDIGDFRYATGHSPLLGKIAGRPLHHP